MNVVIFVPKHKQKEFYYYMKGMGYKVTPITYVGKGYFYYRFRSVSAYALPYRVQERLQKHYLCKIIPQEELDLAAERRATLDLPIYSEV